MVVSQNLNILMVEIFLLMLGTVFGAFLYYLFDVLKQHQKRKRKSKLLATLLLDELRTLEYALRKRYSDEDAANMMGNLPIKIFLNLHEELMFFETETSRILLKFISSIRRVDTVWSATNELDIEEITDFHHWKNRAAAGHAILLIKQTKNALISEGGTLPSETKLNRINYPDLPQIDDPEFKYEVTKLEKK